MRFAILISVAMFLAGCLFGDPPDHITYYEEPPYKNVGSQDPTVGKICVGSDKLTGYKILNLCTGKTVTGTSPPQEPDNITNCDPVPSGNEYIVTCDDEGQPPNPQHTTRPLKVLNGQKWSVFCYYFSF